MTAKFTPISGGIDNIGETKPSPKANSLWAKIITDSSGNAIGWRLYASDGNEWYEV